MDKKTDGYIIQPNPADPRLTERVTGIDQTGASDRDLGDGRARADDFPQFARKSSPP